MGRSTLGDLTALISLFEVFLVIIFISQKHNGCIAVIWLGSISDARKLKEAIVEAADSLQKKEVLQVFIGEELVFDHDRGIIFT